MCGACLSFWIMIYLRRCWVSFLFWLSRESIFIASKSSQFNSMLLCKRSITLEFKEMLSHWWELRIVRIYVAARPRHLWLLRCLIAITFSATEKRNLNWFIKQHLRFNIIFLSFLMVVLARPWVLERSRMGERSLDAVDPEVVSLGGW